MSEKDVKQEEQKEEVIKEVVEEVVEEKEPTKDEIIEALQEEIKQLKNDLLKEHADLQNVKNRLEKERITERKYAGMSIVRNLLTPLDHMSLALKGEVEDEVLKNYRLGFEMIYKELFKVFETEGISLIDCLGEEYDPKYHQAVMTEKVEDKDSNIILEVMQQGYMFKDRVLRPAMVKISE